MTGYRGLQFGLATAATILVVRIGVAQQVREIEENGIRYRITEQEVRVPVTTMQQQQKTVYRQQLTTNTVQSKSLVTVPTTQYRLVSRLRGRWNPLVTPYWTHHYEPVTTWSQQVATVSVPVSRLAWVPETRTVQAPVTQYRTAMREVREPIGVVQSGSGQQYASTNGPSATVAALPNNSSSTARPIGGEQLSSDPPRQASGLGWSPAGADRYRTR